MTAWKQRHISFYTMNSSERGEKKGGRKGKREERGKGKKEEKEKRKMEG